MTMHKALHPKDDKNRKYVLGRGRRSGLTSIEDGVDASIQELEDYIKKSKERIITVACNSTDNIQAKRTTIKTTKQK